MQAPFRTPIPSAFILVAKQRVPLPTPADLVQVRALRPDVHIFGHTHWNIDVRIDKTRFVQHPLGYPRERRNESYRVRTTEIRPHALAWDCTLAPEQINSRSVGLPQSALHTFGSC